MMKKYDSYKDSGVKWIGEIPSHWEETRLRFIGYLFGGLTGKSGDDFKQDDNPNNKPYIPYTNIFRNTYISREHVDYVVIQEGENQNRVEKFDLFFLMSSETYQDLGKPCILIEDVEELYLNSFCKGFRVLHKGTNPLFLNYQLLGDIHKELISIEGRGFTRINLRQDRLNDTPILLPPLSEQQQIVSYLDTKTSQIDSLIEKTQRKIELLKEKRTSIINEVVTKGLNPNVEMKVSGVEWIGEIPSHWEFIKYKNLGDRTTISIGVEDFNEMDVIHYSIPNVQSFGKGVKEYGGEIDSSKLLFKGGELIISKLNPRKSCVSIVETFEDEVIVGSGEFVILVPSSANTKYLFYFLKTQPFTDYLDSSVESVTRSHQRVNPSIIYNTFVPIPPLSEQQEIVSYLDENTQLIDQNISIEERRIELLKEYRQSLISEVVTGKRKVIND